MAQLKFSNKQYLTRSWRMLTREEGWFKTVLLLTLYSLIPIIGGMVTLGASYEWARLTAWGVKSSPKQKGIKFGKCLKTGFVAFVILLIWQVVIGILMSVLESIVPAIGGISWLFIVFAEVLAGVCALYATIYDRFGAAFSFSNLWKMVRHDWKGLLKITGEQFKIGLIIFIVSIPVVFIAGMIWFGSISHTALNQLEMLNETAIPSGQAVLIAFSVLSDALVSLAPAFIVFWVIGSAITTVINLLTANMIGLWMLQFKVFEWGNPDDPLPTPMTPADPGQTSDAAAPAGSPVAPVTPQSSDVSAAPKAPEMLVAPEAPAVSDEPATQATPVIPVEVSEEPEVLSPAQESTEAETSPVEDAAEASEAPVETSEVSHEAAADHEAAAETEEASDDSLSFCPECGSKVPENGTFCPQCGTKLRE